MNRDNSDVYFQQFPNYLSDSQLFPSNLDLQDYSANLLYTDNSRFSGTKKTRKTKELLAHEKNSKDHTVKDIKKQEIIDWYEYFLFFCTHSLIEYKLVILNKIHYKYAEYGMVLILNISF